MRQRNHGAGSAVFDVPSDSLAILPFAAGEGRGFGQAHGSTGRGRRATAGFATDPFAEEGLEALRNQAVRARAGDRSDEYGKGMERARGQGRR
jgi:hypothetical protein